MALKNANVQDGCVDFRSGLNELLATLFSEEVINLPPIYSLIGEVVAFIIPEFHFLMASATCLRFSSFIWGSCLFEHQIITEVKNHSNRPRGRECGKYSYGLD